MRKIPPSSDGMPRVVYTVMGTEGQVYVMVIQNNLSEVPNRHIAPPALKNPRTPDAIRTLMYNELANRARQNMVERLTLAEFVKQHKLPSGDRFFEVRLTNQGREYLEEYHRHYGYYSYYTDYEYYNPTSTRAPYLYKRFAPALRRALAYMGMRP